MCSSDLIAVLAPGQTLREYAHVDSKMRQTTRRVVAVENGTYRLSGAGACTSALEGVPRVSPEKALQCEVGADGLTRQERGMIDRELFPRRKHAGARKKYVRRVRQRSNTVVCDLITEDAKLHTLPMAAILQHHTVGETLKRGRARSHRLPERIAEKLQELKQIGRAHV